ncbi:MAG: hypothetical protein ACYC3B_02395 [Sedimentisphaerales bacterium]
MSNNNLMKCLKEKTKKVLGRFSCINTFNWLDKKSAMVMAITAIIMCFGLWQNHNSYELTRKSLNQTEKSLEISRESLDQTKESLKLQRKEFELRNRPYVVIKNYSFAGEVVSTEGQSYPRSVTMDIMNISEIPANQLRGSYRVVLGGEDVHTIPINQAAIAKVGASKAHVYLQEDTYLAVMKGEKTFEIVTELTYSGMLNEKADAYKTSETVYYSVREKTFKYKDVKYE